MIYDNLDKIIKANHPDIILLSYADMREALNEDESRIEFRDMNETVLAYYKDVNIQELARLKQNQFMFFSDEEFKEYIVEV